MAVMFDTRHWLIDAVNKAHSLALRPADVDFLDVWEKAMLPGGGSNTHNTSVRLRVKETGREFAFSYNRIASFFTDPQTFYDHSLVFVIKIPILQKEGETLAAGMARGFNQQYGIVMSESDIVPNSVTLAADGLSVTWMFAKTSFMYVPATYTVQLTAKHVMVDGQCYQIVEPARVQPDNFYEDSVDGMALDMTKAINVAVATAGNDYSPIGKFLATFKNSDIILANVQASQLISDVARVSELGLKLRSCDRLPWIYSTTAIAVTTPWINIANALPIYNGPTEYFKDDRWKKYAATPTYRLIAQQLRYLDFVNHDFTHVLVLALNAGGAAIANKSSTRNFAILHYNLES